MQPQFLDGRCFQGCLQMSSLNWPFGEEIVKSEIFAGIILEPMDKLVF
jgi:hypothetical protein